MKYINIIKLKDLYKTLEAITNPICGSCPKPYSCCKPSFCHLTERWVGEAYEKVIQRGQRHLPLLGAVTCKVEPYQRPHCSQFICDDAIVSQDQINIINDLKDKIFKLELMNEI